MQIWVRYGKTAKEPLNKANINEENIKEIKNPIGKLQEELKSNLNNDLKEEITKLEQRLTQPTNNILQELETIFSVSPP